MSANIVGGNIIKNLCFTATMHVGLPTDFRRKFCKIGLLLTTCCYSYFDGLYFHYFNGTGLCVQTG